MISFINDYSEGCHENILNALCKTNAEQTIGYGEDEYSKEAKEIIKNLCENDETEIFFLVGGTQTNKTVISSLLRPHQGVFCAESGHINTHESGAIEATGHKVISAKSDDGKITSAQIEEMHNDHWNDSNHIHCVQPAMVYISNPTECGTTYSKKELEEISKVCRERNLILFLDGARLGSGLTSVNNDLTLKDLAYLVDVFYIGGTKSGALFGEALIINKKEFQKDFKYMIKQNGAMLAKGRLLGIQFLELFKDGLYFEITKHSNEMAEKIKNAFKEKGIEMAFDSYTNQQFPIVSDKQMEKLSKNYKFEFWGKKANNENIIRFCTSWATKEDNVLKLVEDIKAL